MRLALCLLTWNEIAGCRQDVPRLPLGQFDEVFAVDNGSQDGTREYLQAQGIVVHSQSLPTYNGAYHCAFRLTTADAVVFFHPKGTIDPLNLLEFRGHFERGADLVVASRIGPGARNEEDDRLVRYRKWFVMGLGLLSSILWRRQKPMVWDVLHGFRGMTGRAFESIDAQMRGVTIDLEMIVRAYRRRLRVAVFPVVEVGRETGSTHFKAWPTGKRMLAYLWAEIRRP